MRLRVGCVRWSRRLCSPNRSRSVGRVVNRPRPPRPPTWMVMVMARISFDTSEVRALVADMTAVDSRLRPDIAAVVKRGATNIKDDMQTQMGASKSFGHLARSISYDMVDDFEAEIGPTKTHSGAKKPPRRGANIAYFGTSKGGGPVEDPETTAERELPAFEEHMLDIAERTVFG